MLKYLNTEITFAEVPDEISLCINITGCPNRCPGCHSQFLWKDVGEPLTTSTLDILIPKSKGISCVCFMGGDQAPEEVFELARYVIKTFQLKTAWYSGKEEFSPEALECFDYIKIGPYIEEKGGLDNPNTNQEFLEIIPDMSANRPTGTFTAKNITYKFWKNEDSSNK